MKFQVSKQLTSALAKILAAIFPYTALISLYYPSMRASAKFRIDLMLLLESLQSFTLKSISKSSHTRYFEQLVGVLPKMAWSKETARFPSHFNPFQMRYLLKQGEEDEENLCFSSQKFLARNHLCIIPGFVFRDHVWIHFDKREWLQSSFLTLISHIDTKIGFKTPK